MNLSVVFSVILGCIGAGPALADLLVRPGSDGALMRVQAVRTPEASKRVLELSATMQIGEILTVMRQEGLDYGKSLEDEMFPGKGGAAWTDAVDRIYDEVAMKSVFDTALVLELAAVDPATLEVIEAFFGSERGQRILTLEIEARRALLDQDIEDAAKVHVEELAAKDDPRMELIRKFAEANDLVEMNVAGALNANLAFFKGLAEGGGLEKQMTEEEMLTNVWSQEPAIRNETQTWLFPYLALAYQPLSDDDIQAYLAFSELTEGKVLNAAIFSAFNTLFSDISGSLGREAAKQMRGEDI